MPTHSRSAGRAPRGLSLIEVLIVVSLLGALSAFGLPTVNKTIRQRRVIAASVAVSRDVETAFSLAARQRRPVRLSFDASSGEMRVTDRAATTVYRRRPLLLTSEYKLDAVAMSPDPVEVFPNGVSSAGFTVTLTNGSFSRQVVVARTGLTRVVVP
jgi:prepilin-type N-terminal cleavage/methylation domain-containing protein